MSFTVFDLANLFQDREKFVEWLREKRLLFDFSDVQCDCGCFLVYIHDISYSDNYCWKCSDRRCRRKLSERTGSWFSNRRITYESILKLTYFWANQYSVQLCHRETSLSENTVFDWYNLCREVCIDVLDSRDDKFIGGPEIVVEIDESKYEKKKYLGGKGVDGGVWIFGGIERNDRDKCFLVVVEDRNAETLISIIEKYVAKGSVIVSNEWEGYSQIGHLGYKHITVNKGLEFKNPFTGYQVDHMATSWYGIKAEQNFYSKPKSLSGSYFAEFVFRRKFLSGFKNSFLLFISKGINAVYYKEKSIEIAKEKWSKATIKRHAPPPMPIVYINREESPESAEKKRSRPTSAVERPVSPPSSPRPPVLDPGSDSDTDISDIKEENIIDIKEEDIIDIKEEFQ